jgi:hypothetical protein
LTQFLDDCYVVVDRPHLDELLNAPNETLSFHHAFADAMELKHIFNPGMATDAYHVPIVRTKLTQSINSTMDACVDEMKAAFDDVMQVTNGMRSQSS